MVKYVIRKQLYGFNYFLKIKGTPKRVPGMDYEWEGLIQNASLFETISQFVVDVMKEAQEMDDVLLEIVKDTEHGNIK